MNAVKTIAMRLIPTVFSSFSSHSTPRIVVMLSAGLLSVLLSAPALANASAQPTKSKPVTASAPKQAKVAKKATVSSANAKRFAPARSVAAAPMRASFGQKSAVGHRFAKNRLHQRSRSVLGHASPSVRPQADHGVPGFSRQTQPYCRC